MHRWMTCQKRSLSSPPLSPPLAKPAAGRWHISMSRHGPAILFSRTHKHRRQACCCERPQAAPSPTADALASQVGVQSALDDGKQALLRRPLVGRDAVNTDLARPSGLCEPMRDVRGPMPSGTGRRSHHRSSQRMERCIASSTRGPLTRLLTTSSSCCRDSFARVSRLRRPCRRTANPQHHHRRHGGVRPRGLRVP